MIVAISLGTGEATGEAEAEGDPDVDGVEDSVLNDAERHGAALDSCAVPILPAAKIVNKM